MAVGENILPELKPVPGITIGTANAGIKQRQRDDIAILTMAEGSSCAAVFTQNAFCAAPVLLARENLQKKPRWLLINSGNANAGTGRQGIRAAQSTCAALAELVAARPESVLPFSTGVIGENLPAAKIAAALPAALAALSEHAWEAAARAIMTTDTFAKGSSRQVTIAGETMTITGIAKGAGMIQPNMATMLAFIGCDAKIARPLLQQCLEGAVEQTFNRITVDGDTSTNDACVLMASGCSAAPEITGSCGLREFSGAVLEVCQDLAEAIIRDGEGATKFIRIVVQQAVTEQEALQVAKTIAHSPLVKTAFFASDPNWGRILAAVGRAGIADLDIDRIVMYFGDVCIVRNGGRADDYRETDGQRVMAGDEITVTVDLGRGQEAGQVLTCDFSYDYVRINAEYRT